MTWTYTNPDTSYRDAIRLLIGDTDSTDPLLTDEELAAVAKREGGVASLTAAPDAWGTALAAAAACAMTLATKFAGQTGFSIGGYSEQSQARSERFSTLADELRAKAGRYAAPRATGLSVAGEDTRDADTDALQPAFRRGQHDFPGTSTERRFLDPTLDDV